MCVVFVVKKYIMLAKEVFLHFVLYRSNLKLHICAACCPDSKMELIV